MRIILEILKLIFYLLTSLKYHDLLINLLSTFEGVTKKLHSS